MRSDEVKSDGMIDDEKTRAMIVDATARLRGWLERERWGGIEPHDALTSPLLDGTPLGRSRFIRLAALQGLRRLPVNVRPLLGVKPRINAISLGWALKGYAMIDDDGARAQIEWALAELKRMEATGYSGACWGYYFDWQTRDGFKRRDLPIIVSTAFIGEGLLDVYEKQGRPELLQWARGACEFIMKDLNRTPGKRGFCFSYSPEDHQVVFNASILGAALLARTGALTGERELIEAAREAVAFVVDHQREDGSWLYGVGGHWDFIDNFHTGYVLMALKEYIESSGDESFRGALERGWSFYREQFFLDGGVPKYYHDRLYPIDAHAAAQSIVTLVAFGDLTMAIAVARWTISQMQRGSGAFIYQIHQRYRNTIFYLRWSNAWMLYALANLSSVAYIHPAKNTLRSRN